MHEFWSIKIYNCVQNMLALVLKYLLWCFGMTESVKETQAKSAYMHLRRLLLHGQILQGERLTEAKWSKRLVVTRSALRKDIVRAVFSEQPSRIAAQSAVGEF